MSYCERSYSQCKFARLGEQFVFVISKCRLHGYTHTVEVYITHLLLGQCPVSAVLSWSVIVQAAELFNETVLQVIYGRRPIYLDLLDSLPWRRGCVYRQLHWLCCMLTTLSHLCCLVHAEVIVCTALQSSFTMSIDLFSDLSRLLVPRFLTKLAPGADQPCSIPLCSCTM